MTPDRKYLEHLFRDAGRVELCHQINGRMLTTWHTEPVDLIRTAQSKAQEGSLFTSLNHVGRWRQEPVTNDDIDRFVRLLFDFDPVRPARDISSTAEELQAAKERSLGLQRLLSGHGWPVPAVAMSGNGYHLQYRMALPNTSETREQLAAIYAGLYVRFNDDVVEFDRSVRSPGQICALYGTLKRKGSPTADRPHRQSRIQIPQDWRQVRPRAIEKLANTYAKEAQKKRQQTASAPRSADLARGTGDYSSLDVVDWFAAHGAYLRHIEGNKHAVVCPWSAEHTTSSPRHGSDTIIFEADGGWPGFFCHHQHCDARRIGDVLALWGDADQFCGRTFRREAAHV